MTKERQYVAVQELPPGRQIQVDFGMVSLSREDGSETRGRFIAFVLAHSRYKYVEWLDRPFKVADMVRCHENAFHYFGGRTCELVYDQDALVAVNENNGDLLLTESFQSYVSFRGFHVHLCRARDPESKGKVERVVQYVKSNFVLGRSYYHLKEWNQRCLEWLERASGDTIVIVDHETGEVLAEHLLALERGTLVQAANHEHDLMKRKKRSNRGRLCAL